MWIYAAREKELYAADVTSLSQLNGLSSEVKWLWVDIFNPDQKESEIISELLGNEPTIVDNIKEGTYNPTKVCGYERLHDYVLLSIPSVNLEEELRMYPIYIIIKKKMLITWGEEKAHRHSKIVNSTIARLREHVEEGGKLTSSLAIGMLFREVACKNSDVMLSIRESIEQIEEKAMEEAGEKKTMRSVFSLKRKISTLYRLLTNEKVFMLDVSEMMIPHIRLDKKMKSIVDDAIDIIDRELEFMNSYDRALDSVLTLQDLASIHRVESSINFLTIVLVIGTIILIILELLAKLGFPLGGH